MADPTLSSALSGLQFAPIETGWGIGAQGVAQALPALQNPYANPLQNLGVTLGGALVASLLGYQARKEAFDLGLQSQNYANQMMAMQTPAERTAFLETLPSDAISSGIGGRLSTLSTALGQQEALQKALIGQEVAKKQALAEFELGDIGTKIFERQQKAELDKALSVALANRSGGEVKTWWDKIGAAQKAAFTGTAGQVKQLRDLANKFQQMGTNAVELNIEKQIPGSNADLAISAMQTLVPSTVKMLGDTGALSAYDQEAVKKATLGGRLSGSLSIAARLNQLADLAESKTVATMEQYKTAAESGPDVLLSQLKSGAETGIGESPAEKKNRELKEQLKRLEELAAQRR